MITTAFLRTLGTLRHGFIFGILVKTALLTIGLFILLGTLTTALLASFPVTDAGWLSSFIAGAAGAGVMVLGYFLMPIFFPLISLLFLNRAAKGTEAVYYPNITAQPAPSFAQALPAMLRFIAKSLFLNLLALPLYLIPGLNLVLYYLINGYLLGREYGEMLGVRYHSLPETLLQRKAQRGKFFVAGLFISIGFTVPLLNLAAPLLATILMVHLWQDAPAKGDYTRRMPGRETFKGSESPLTSHSGQKR